MGLRKGERKWWDSGSPRKEEQAQAAVRMHGEGLSQAAIGRVLGVSRQRVGAILAREERQRNEAAPVAG